MSDFKQLKAEYVALAGKNPPPMSAGALAAKVAELKAASSAPPVQGESVTVPEASQPEIESAQTSVEGVTPSAGGDPETQAPTASADDEVPANVDANADEPAQSTEDACQELGLSINDDGHCQVEILESIAGGIHLSRGDRHRFEAAEAVRAVRAGIAKPRS